MSYRSNPINNAVRNVYANNQMVLPSYEMYVFNYLTNTKIPFSVMPTNISETYKANYSEQNPIGTSRPIVSYTSTSLRSISFTLQNVSNDYLPDGYSNLTDYVHALQALTFPEYQSSGWVKPPDCHLYLGSRSFRCVCNNVDVTWSDLVRDNQIMTCSISLTFTNTRNNDEIPRCYNNSN